MPELHRRRRRKRAREEEQRTGLIMQLQFHLNLSIQVHWHLCSAHQGQPTKYIEAKSATTTSAPTTNPSDGAHRLSSFSHHSVYSSS